ncbi:hypothetical protein [uncultured Hoeflea sp.]|uniref:hypothetical protein n=1 Tax=uncultured Hoeflea sp. TaxID=538666 RepID=UPI00260346EA|nr:hypothetical protein [uncultured Hoeflea sp.]
MPATQISYEQDFGYSGGRNAESPSVGRGSNSHDGTRGYNEAPDHTNGWGDHSPGSGGRGGGGSSGKPILFDLNGDGISITERDDSAHYFDIGGDGYDHRTAWAGIGDGVLVIDADGDGQISGKKEVVFTDWDPSADSDMEALRQVFDTNGNGLFDAGDAAWNDLYIMVTQADGSTVMKSRQPA